MGFMELLWERKRVVIFGPKARKEGFVGWRTQLVTGKYQHESRLTGATVPVCGSCAGGLAARPCGFFLRRRLELGELRRPLFWDHFFALRRAIEGHDFAQGQLAKLSRRDVETERSVADPADLFDVVADLFKHLADLAVASFG